MYVPDNVDACDGIERAWNAGCESIRTKVADNRFPAHCAGDQCYYYHD